MWIGRSQESSKGVLGLGFKSKFGFLALTIFILISYSSAQQCLSSEVDISPLISGVNFIHAYGIGGVEGVPGPLEALNSNIATLPFISAEDNAPKNVAMASCYGSGRVVALGHDGFFINEGINDVDNRQFGENIVNWLNERAHQQKEGSCHHRSWRTMGWDRFV